MGGNNTKSMARGESAGRLRPGDHLRSASSNQISITNKKHIKLDDKYVRRQAELESSLGYKKEGSQVKSGKQGNKMPESVMSFGSKEQDLQKYPEVKVQNVGNSFSELTSEIKRGYNNTFELAANIQPTQQLLMNSGSSKAKAGRLTKVSDRTMKDTSNSIGRTVISSKDRCCISCKQSKPQKCWRQLMREELGRKNNYQQYGWYQSILKELDNQREDEQEKIFVAQLTYLNSDDQSSICMSRETLMQRLQQRSKPQDQQDKILPVQTVNSKEDCARETGQSVLRTHQTFHDRVHLIKQHVANQKHSLNRLIKAFKKKFYKENINQLRKYSEFEQSNGDIEIGKIDPQSPQTEKSVKKNVKDCHMQLHFFINTVVNAIIKYYNIEMKAPAMGGSDLKKDLLINLATNFVLSDDIYFLIFNMISISQQQELHKLTKLLHDKAFLKASITFQHLKLKPQFTFDTHFRDNYHNLGGSSQGVAGSSGGLSNLTDSASRLGPGQPAAYKETIKNMLQTLQIESPMCKLEQIFHSCTISILEDLELFYKDSNFPREKLFIDSDTLQAILIYIVSRSAYPQLWTELILIEEYIPEGVTMSNRAFYLIMVKAACEYLINFKDIESSKGSGSPQGGAVEGRELGTPLIEMYDEVYVEGGNENNQTPDVEDQIYNSEQKITPEFPDDEFSMKRYSLFDNQTFLRMRTHSVLVPSSSQSNSLSPKKGVVDNNENSDQILTTIVQEEASAFFFENNFILKDEIFEFKEGLRNIQGSISNVILKEDNT